MNNTTQTPAWKRIQDLLGAGDTAGLALFFNELGMDEMLRAVFRLSHEEQMQLLTSLTPDSGAELLEELPDAHAAELMDALSAAEAASIVEELNSDEQADLLRDLDPGKAETILEYMELEDAADARRLLHFADDVAGGLMMTELLSFQEDTTVAEVIADLSSREEDYAYYNVQYVYVVDPGQRLRGVLRLRDMVFRPAGTRIGEMAIQAASVTPQTGLDELEELFEARPLNALPVVDAHGRLLGVVRRDAVQEALNERVESDSLKMQGIVGGEELRSMPVLLRSRRRLSWLSVNIVLNLIAASVIALYQDTLSAVIALAVFLPIVSDMSGCSGNQAVAVSLRELTLGIILPADAFRVWIREVAVGLLNGLALGSLIAGAAWLWQGSPVLGLVVGAALAINTVVAVSMGGTVPLLLRALHIDPALASGPILTTVTDMFGFFLVLSFATLALPLLTA